MRIRDLVHLPFRLSSDAVVAPHTAKNMAAPLSGAVDYHNDGSNDDDDDFEDRHRTAVYDPSFVPSGGWDQWCEWAIGQGKIARIIQSRAKNAMCGRLISDDKVQQDALDAFTRKLHLSTAMIRFYMNYEGRGRAILEPVWSFDVFGRKKDLVRLNHIHPSTVRVFRDNANDIRELKEYLKGRKDARLVAYGLTLKAGTGFNIIGFVQNFEGSTLSSLITDPDGDGDPTVFFFPDELIFLPRYPGPRWPDGLALSRQNYVVIMNKLGIERDQAIMARRHGDPKHKFVIPANLWDKREDIKRELKRGMRAGYDFFFKGRAATGDPDPMDVSIVAPSGNPMSVAKAQDHIEDEFVAAMGFADSFTESGSSNRSVGEIQLDFFERDLAPERQLVAEILEDQLINPWLKTQGYDEGSAWFVFEDLSVDDKVKKGQLISPLIPYLPASVLIRFLDNMGYPLSKAEIAALEAPAPAPSDPASPSDPADPQLDPDGSPRMMMSQNWQELVAPGAHVPKVNANEPDFINTTGGPMTVWQLRNLASQAGIPKPILQTAKPAREQMKKEIEDMRDDITDMLGL